MSQNIPNIPFIDLAAQQNRIRPQIDQAVKTVLDHGRYVMGPEVGALEDALAEYCGVKHAIGCSSGTDALAMVLMAKKLRAQQVVFCPSFTFVATAEVVAWLGAKVYFVDVDPKTFNMDPASLGAAVQKAKDAGEDLAGVIAVDLFGLPYDYDAISKIANDHDMWLLSDTAQSFGARYHNASVASHGLAAATSFFPAKPLGCYGDGGAMFTDDDQLADDLRSILFHGKGTSQYDNVRIGMTGRIDTLQAAILIEKLKIFDEEIAARQTVADKYHAGLSSHVTCPYVPQTSQSVWAQYTIRLPEHVNRDALQADLKTKGIPTAVYYIKPLHLQDAYKHNPIASDSLPVTEALSKDVLSLPMHPYLTTDIQDYIIEHFRVAIEAQS